jgi:hypothetical protein
VKRSYARFLSRARRRSNQPDNDFDPKGCQIHALLTL